MEFASDERKLGGRLQERYVEKDIEEVNGRVSSDVLT